MAERGSFTPAVVIPVGPGRAENARLAVEHLRAMSEAPVGILLVCDGPDARMEHPLARACWLAVKHRPGMEQPRNVGARLLSTFWPEANAVWFVDSDVLMHPQALSAYREAWERCGPAVMFGPYLEYSLPAGVREPVAAMESSGLRTELFERCDGEVSRGHVATALASFGGNLLWPLDWFLAVGGFDRRLHHGRAEDGMLGLTAASMRVPLVAVRGARGWHLDHSRDMRWILEANRRDVPIIWETHGRAEDYADGLVPVAQDGMRLNWRCPRCATEINTLAIWEHDASCPLKSRV